MTDLGLYPKMEQISNIEDSKDPKLSKLTHIIDVLDYGLKINNETITDFHITPSRYGPRNIPRNCEERIRYEHDICRLLESSIGGEPDLVCLAGYDQWLTDWIVDKYYPKILNVHPGDTTKGYDGLYWIPSAKAILAGEEDSPSM
jgi:hypothetical protein